VVSELQPTMDNSSIMMNWIFGHMFIIELSLLIVVCLLINNPNKECILFHLLIRLRLQCMLIQNLLFSCFQKIYFG
jgi:hypothetical protein